tara:strand:- start:38 stop:388 length:351 start_codon:yes stop_codon:yes gene_type:complete
VSASGSAGKEGSAGKGSGKEAKRKSKEAKEKAKEVGGACGASAAIPEESSALPLERSLNRDNSAVFAMGERVKHRSMLTRLPFLVEPQLRRHPRGGGASGAMQAPPDSTHRRPRCV